MYTALILAAGKGERTGLKENKIKYEIAGKPLFQHSVDKFLNLGFKVVLVIRKEDQEYIASYLPNIDLVYGGKQRFNSVENGLKKVTTKYVFIHDAARPFIAEDLIEELKENLASFDAALIAKKVSNTIYDNCLNIIDRNQLIAAETPQAFLTEKIKKAYENRQKKEYTDDISVYKDYYEDPIGVLIHRTNNDKITTLKDVEKYMKPQYKIGHSYDIHQTAEKRKLILGGVLIPAKFGLLGHSDADVLLHAVGESIIGALGLGDLGTHFPDTDQKHQDLDSKVIIEFCRKKLVEHNYLIENIDATIYLEAPKLAPFMNKIKENIASLLKITVENINIKAATNEKLDSIGNQKAIAAESVCLLKKTAI